MERHVINADHTWQDADGFVQALEVRNGQRVLYCSGQLSVAPNGKLLHPGDMRAQIGEAMNNLDRLLQAAGFTLSDIARLNVYTTNMDACLANFDAVISHLAGVRPACTLLGVTRLAWPEAVVEIEATAVSG